MSAIATEQMERKTTINVLLVENDPDYAAQFKEQLSRMEKITGNVTFEVEHLSSYKENIEQAADNKDLVVLDIYVDGKMGRSFAVAKELIRQRPERAVIFLTAFPEIALDRVGKVKAPFTLQKNETVLGRLDILMVKIFALQKSRSLLKSALEMSQQHDQSYWDQNYKTVATELMDLNFSMGVMDRYMTARQLVAPLGYRKLSQALRPMCPPDAFGRAVFSRDDLVDIKESNLVFVEGALGVLKQIGGVFPNPYLEKELEQLKHIDAGTVDEVQHVESQGGEAEAAVEKAREKPKDVVKKYTDVSFPKVCVLNEKVSLKIQFKTESPGHVVNVPFDGGEEVDVLICISGDGFEINENSKSISVPRDSESDVTEFIVQPRKLGEQYLFIYFYRNTVRIGCIVACTFVGKEEGRNERD